jgi:uncharacterized protein (UPF0216 family)
LSPSIDKLIEHEIDTLNDHLPESRVTLKELLTSEVPRFVTRCGDESVFRAEDIEFLRLEVPEMHHDDIRLPIVILRRLDYGPGIYTVAGNKVELFTIHKILGYDDLSWEKIGAWKPIERLARPQVQILRQKMPSTTTIGIVYATTKEKLQNDRAMN